MTSLLVTLYAFLAIFLAFTGYCLVAATTSESREPQTVNFPLGEPTTAP